jgi:galactarate dehydratase
MVVSLGCEKLQPARLLPQGSIPVQNGPYIVTLQDEAQVGFESMVDSIMGMAKLRLAALKLRKRETGSAADLIVGVQCGGSDAFSGVTANRAVGAATDLLVRAGATVMFSETTEVRGGIDQLTSRAVNQEVVDAMIREMAWYDE